MATTKTDVMERVQSMLPEVNKIIMENAEHLLASGAIDLDNWDDNFRLPKAILCASLDLVERQFIADCIKPTVRNLKKF